MCVDKGGQGSKQAASSLMMQFVCCFYSYLSLFSISSFDQFLSLLACLWSNSCLFNISFRCHYIAKKQLFSCFSGSFFMILITPDDLDYDFGFKVCIDEFPIVFLWLHQYISLQNDINQDDEEVTAGTEPTTTSEITELITTSTIISTTNSTSSSTTSIPTTTETTASTSTTLPEDGLSYETKLALGLGGGAVLLILIILSIVIFMYVRGKRRKIQGAYNPAYLEQLEEDRARQQRKKMDGPFIIPLPQPERLI